MIADHAVLTHIHAVNKAEEVSYSSFWTLAQSHSLTRQYAIDCAWYVVEHVGYIGGIPRRVS